jgi:hypothetical protein
MPMKSPLVAAAWSRVCLVVACVAIAGAARATDAGQWAGSSPEVQQWFRSLMQPDHPMVSCCGEADGFPVAHWEAAGPDQKDYRVTLEDGRTFFVLAEKAQWRYGNPTGRDILFVGSGGTVYCFVLGSGI